jgi:hypothetical protein
MLRAVMPKSKPETEETSNPPLKKHMFGPELAYESAYFSSRSKAGKKLNVSSQWSCSAEVLGRGKKRQLLPRSALCQASVKL